MKKKGRSNLESTDLVAGAGQLNSLVQFRKQYITRHPEPCQRSRRIGPGSKRTKEKMPKQVRHDNKIISKEDILS